MDGKLKELIEKEFGMLDKMTPEKRAEVFIVFYMRLVELLENDFDVTPQLKVVSVTHDKSKEKKDEPDNITPRK